jgi:hypothetical protein
MSSFKPEAFVERYLQCIRARDLEGIVALFADDASCVMPNGQSFAGHAAVRQWFANVFAAQALDPQVLGVIAGPTSIAVEIENVLPDGSVRNTANFYFLTSAGKIERLHTYRRG